jgi:hypothetical protein
MQKLKLPLKLLFICCMFVFNSCSKEIEMDIHSFERKVVVNTVFSPDNPFKFYFSYSVTPIESYSKFTDSIHLFLYEDGKKVLDKIFLSDSLLTTYYPRSGCKYLLKMCVQGYDTIFARDTIPQRLNIIDATKQAVSVDQYKTEVCDLRITFEDPVTEKNFYELYFKNQQYDWENEITDPVLLNEGDVGYYPDTYFFSDEMFNGTKYTMHIKRSAGFNTTTRVIIRNISRNYYLYRKIWTRHIYNQSGADRGVGNLIYMGEPIPMFNNIINGFGVFASFNENDPYTFRILNEN